MSVWKFWIIKEAREQPQVRAKQMKKKFKSLLKYKLCDASEDIKVDIYEQLLKTLGRR